MLGVWRVLEVEFRAREIIVHVDWVDTKELQGILRQESSIEILFVFEFGFSMLWIKVDKKWTHHKLYGKEIHQSDYI